MITQNIRLRVSPLRLVWALIAILSLGACTGERTPFREHQGPIAPALEAAPAAWTAPQEASLAALSDIANRSYEISQEIEAADADTLERISGTLASQVLHEGIFRNPRAQGDTRATRTFALLNMALDRLQKRAPERFARLPLVAHYESFILGSCPRSVRNCRNLPFAASDSLTAGILLEAARARETRFQGLQATLANTAVVRTAEETAALRAQYHAEGAGLSRSMLAISDLLNSQSNTDYLLRYVRLGRSFTSYYNDLNLSERRTMSESLRTHLTFLNTALVLLRAQSGSASRTAYCNYVIELEPYRFNFGQPGNTERATMHSMVGEFIRCAQDRETTADGGSVLARSIGRFLEEDRVRARTASADDIINGNSYRIPDVSFAYALSFLEKTPETLATMEVDATIPNDLAFFVVDRLFYEAIDQRLAVDYWRAIRNQDDLKLLKFIRNYVKVQLLYLLKATQVILSKSFEDEYKTRGLSGQSFQRIVDRVNQATQNEWDTYKTRIHFIRQFLIPIYEERLSRSTGLTGAALAASEEYTALRSQLDALPDNLNYVAVGPLMLGLSYYMAKAQGTIPIDINWFVVNGRPYRWSMDATNALARFFDTKLDFIRWFPMGSSDAIRVWDEFQMSHVFDFTLKTGLFDAFNFAVVREDEAKLKFGGNKSLNGEWLFFLQYIDDILKRQHLVSSLRVLDTIDQSFANQQVIERARRICAQPLDIDARFKPEDMSGQTLGPVREIESLTSIYGRMGNFQGMKTGLTKVEDLLDQLRDHFYRDGAERRLPAEKLAVRDQIIGAIENELEPYYRVERGVLQRALNADRIFVNNGENCFQKLHGAELLRQNTLMDNMKEHYLDVHAAMTLRRALLRLPQDSLNLGEGLTTADEISQRARALAARALAEWQNSDEAVTARAENAAESTRMTARLEKMVEMIFHPQVIAKHQLTGANLTADSFARFIDNSLRGAFQVHNTAPVYLRLSDGGMVEYGTFVRGIQPHAGDVQTLLLPYETFEPNFYRQNRRDTLYRLASKLETAEVDGKTAAEKLGMPASRFGGENARVRIAPNVIIEAGVFATLATDSFFTKRDLVEVPFHANPKVFLAEAMGQFAGVNRSGNQFVSWFVSTDTMGLRLMNQRAEFIKNLMNSGPFEVSATNKKACPSDIWREPTADPTKPECQIYSVPAKSYLDEFVSLVSNYNLDKETRERLDLVNHTNRYAEKVESAFKYRGRPDTSEWTYFDNFYRTNFTGHRGRRMDGTEVTLDRIDGAWQFEDFYDSLRMRIRPSTQFFSINQEQVQRTRNQVRRLLLRQLIRVNDVEETIYDMEENRTALPPIVFEKVREVRTDSSYFEDNWRVLAVRNREGGERAGKPILLRDDSESAKEWFRNVIQDFFISDTNCDALPKPADPDFAWLPAQTKRDLNEQIRVGNEPGRIFDCRQYFAIWNRGMEELRLEARAARRSR